MSRRKSAPATPVGSAFPTFQRDDVVDIIDGSAVGTTARVVGRWHDMGGVPTYALQLPLGQSIIRADFLRRVGGVR